MKKQKKNQLKQVQNQAQEGRSMVEMLGVLAIIGVLSIGSLSGYEYATASYRAGQIRDALLTAKKTAAINTSASYTNELKRLLKGSLPSYGASVEEMSSGQYHYQVQLTGVAPRTCAHLWEMQNVLDSFSIKMTSPGEKKGCQLNNTSVNTVSMSFAFNALDNPGGGSGEPSCAGCSSEFCIGGVCVECRTSADCPADQVCDERTGQCTEDCSKGVCQTGHCINHRCGECEEPTPKWNGKNCVACPPSAPQWNGVDCEALEVETTTPTTESTTPETTTTPESTNPECNLDTCPGNKCNKDGTCDCPEGTTWNNGECACADNNQHLYGNQCVTCDASTGGTWDSTSKRCKCDNGIWDMEEGKCVEASCGTGGTCDEKQYCDTTHKSNCSNHTNGTCEDIDVSNVTEKKINKKTYYLGPNVDWWTAQRYCQALAANGKGHGLMVSLEELGCTTTTGTAGCASDGKLQKALYSTCKKGDTCCTEGMLCCDEDSECTTFGDKRVWTSTTVSSTSCYAYSVSLNNGTVGTNGRYRDGYALCE